MTAPGLITLAHRSGDPRSRSAIEALTAEVRRKRPDLKVESAYLAPHAPTLETAATRLARRGVEEIVVVPLLLTAPAHDRVEVARLVSAASAHLDGLPIRATEALGLGPEMLEVLDVRLRAALAAARARELDALVLAGAGSTDPLANQAVARLARVWGARHRLPVAAAYASAAPPATGEAVRAFRAQGRRHVAVGSLLLTPGSRHDRASELALEAGAIAVSDPLGAHPLVADKIVARYLVGALELVPV